MVIQFNGRGGDDDDDGDGDGDDDDDDVTILCGNGIWWYIACIYIHIHI